MMRVVIVGGGLAGLAAAWGLARRGVDVEIVEARPRLGGRASSFLDPASEEWIDNCQHVSMGCCTNLAWLWQQTGVAPLVGRHPTLTFCDETGRTSRLGPSWFLPAPLHTAPGFLAARFLSLSDKIRIAFGLWRLLRGPADDPRPFRQWLLEHRQTERTLRRFWEVVLISALNERLDNLAFRYARQVFIEGMLWDRRSGVVEIPAVPLDQVYEAIRAALESLGVAIRTNQAVERLEFASESAATSAGPAGNQRVVEARTRAASLSGDHFLLAVPFQRVADLVGDRAGLPPFEKLGRIATSPITSVHCWFDRPVMKPPHLVVVGRTVQWLFRRTENSAAKEYIQAVISASYELVGLGKQRIIETVLEDIRAVLPASGAAELVHCRVVTEKSATFSATVGIDELRPGQATPIPNLWLAGDYTSTGWPATMEGAVRSGFLAAEQILAAAGQPAKLLQDPLEGSWLSRWLIRRR